MRAENETAETVEECAEKADCATGAEKVCNEATLEDDDECGDDQGTENMSAEEYAGVVEEIIDEGAEPPQDGKEEDDESRHCEEQVGEPPHAEEEAGKARHGEEQLVEEDRGEKKPGGDDSRENWK
ncbi:hypothetical protein MTO96_031846 [Rhipicephalus appendiculatus]